MTSILSSLKLANTKRQQAQNPIEFRRQKLSNILKEQVALATAMNNGVTPSAEALSAQAIQLGKALNDPVQ